MGRIILNSYDFKCFLLFLHLGLTFTMSSSQFLLFLVGSLTLLLFGDCVGQEGMLCIVPLCLL